MTTSVDQVKVRSEHLARLAFVYVRQSSARQVRNNLESQRLQYGFAEQAVALGWTRDRITVLDEDQGRRLRCIVADPPWAPRDRVRCQMSIEVERIETGLLKMRGPNCAGGFDRNP